MEILVVREDLLVGPSLEGSIEDWTDVRYYTAYYFYHFTPSRERTGLFKIEHARVGCPAICRHTPDFQMTCTIILINLLQIK
jgi:hypothetical protein